MPDSNKAVVNDTNNKDSKYSKMIIYLYSNISLRDTARMRSSLIVPEFSGYAFRGNDNRKNGNDDNDDNQVRCRHQC